MAPFATPVDLAGIWRPLSEEEAASAETWLNLASVLIRDRFTDIDQRIAAGTLDPALAGHVAAMMVRRAMTARDPEDPISEGIGEARQAWQPGDGETGLYITAQEAALLTPPTTRRGRSRTMTLGVGLPLP